MTSRIHMEGDFGNLVGTGGGGDQPGAREVAEVAAGIQVAGTVPLPAVALPTVGVDATRALRTPPATRYWASLWTDIPGYEIMRLPAGWQLWSAPPQRRHGNRNGWLLTLSAAGGGSGPLPLPAGWRLCDAPDSAVQPAQTPASDNGLAVERHRAALAAGLDARALLVVIRPTPDAGRAVKGGGLVVSLGAGPDRLLLDGTCQHILEARARGRREAYAAQVEQAEYIRRCRGGRLTGPGTPVLVPAPVLLVEAVAGQSEASALACALADYDAADQDRAHNNDDDDPGDDPAYRTAWQAQLGAVRSLLGRFAPDETAALELAAQGAHH